MKMISVKRERAGHGEWVPLVDGERKWVDHYHAGWVIRLRGRRVGWRSSWADAMRVALNFAEEYYAQPVALFSAPPEV